MSKKAVKGNGTKTKAKPTVTKPKEKKERKPRGNSVTHQICAAMVKDPGLEFDAVCKKIGISTPKAGSFQYLVYNVARQTLQLAAGK